MKIYLQDCQTLKFIRCDSSWSANLNEALDFITTHRATVYGLTELKDTFQLVQVKADGLQSLLSAAVRQLPAIKMVTVPRPARVAREIFRRIRPSPNLRPAGQALSPILSVRARAH